VQSPATHHGAIFASSKLGAQNGCATLHLPGETSVPVPHEYVQPHSAATTGRHRFAAADASAFTGVALVTVVTLAVGAAWVRSSREHETSTTATSHFVLTEA